MREIKLNRELFESEKTGIALDQDDSGLFYRLTLRVAHPVTKDSAYMEYNKEDSKSLLIQKEDGIYVKEEDVSYLKESWQANEYENRLAAIAWKPAVRDVDVPAYWYDTTVQIIPQKTAMYDEVFVNEEIVKIDYAVGCTGKLKTEYEELINKIKEKFPNEHDFLSNENNIIGKYNDNHTIRPPYKSQNTMTVYHMYYDKDIFSQFLKDYKIPEHDYAYRFWFGLKYDLDSGVRYLKVVIGDDDKKYKIFGESRVEETAKKFNKENEIVFTIEGEEYQLGEMVHQAHNDNGMEFVFKLEEYDDDEPDGTIH